jgi:hypothetical protein
MLKRHPAISGNANFITSVLGLFSIRGSAMFISLDPGVVATRFSVA